MRIRSYVFFILSLAVVGSIKAAPEIESGNTFEQLQNFALIFQGKPIRLHLGCGENHLHGYINIDFPILEHTVQLKSGADIFCDITKLSFPEKSIHEIRSHHVFEHFDRPSALALLCAWHQWLELDGVLVIETPDFFHSIQMLVGQNYTYEQKQIVLRHIFGSHEAQWAIHCDGWYQEKFEHILQKLGYKVVKVEKKSWQLLRNITIIARKVEEKSSLALLNIAKDLLKESMVDHSLSEQHILDIWYKCFSEKFNILRKAL